MKIAWKLISMMAIAAVAISCLKVEPTPQFSKSATSFSVTPSVTTVAVTAADSLSNAISFSWNDPKYAVGLSGSKFSVIVSGAGTNFASFSSKNFTGVLTGDLLGKELNGMVLKCGGVIGQPFTIDVKVIASQTNNDEPKQSNIVQITVTPYGDLTLTPSSTAVVCAAATSSQVGDTFTWTTAFNGYVGVKTYQFQYAKGGTSFSSPTVVAVTSFSKTFTQLDLNKMALGFGIPAGGDGTVDFRIKATNELGTVIFSNIATVTVTTYVANNSIGIIGDATPGGWNTDTDLYRPDPVNNPGDWTVTLYLTGGLSAKFRADDLWDTNWGSTGFPSGTGTQNGANIPVNNSGYYQVNFNAGTGVYSFAPLAGTTHANISLIGDVVGTAWTSDFDLTQDASNAHLWTGTISFAANGQVKFRANHDWTTSWGSSTFPSGYSATSNEPNIAVTQGTYFVRLNDVSGEFFFGNTSNNAETPYGRIGIIGDATPNGWNDPDTQLIQNPANPYKWSGKVTLTGSGTYAKFRADNGWTVNWGATIFPKGVGTQNGPNIPATAGTYQITFNSATGEYTFTN